MKTNNFPSPPKIKKITQTTTHHNFFLKYDPYHWMESKEFPEVTDKEILEHLHKENAYFESILAPSQKLQQDIYLDLKSRISKELKSVPVKDGDFLYWWEFKADAEYRVWFRQNIETEKKGIILDENALAKEHKEYWKLGDFAISPDDQKLAWSQDHNGSERFNIKISHKTSDGNWKASDVSIPDTNGDIIWHNNSLSFYYIVVDKHWRPFQVKQHILGSNIEEDRVVYTEKSPDFFMGISETQSRKYLLIKSGTHFVNETHYLEKDTDESTLQCFHSRDHEHEYTLDHVNEHFYAIINDTHPNFRCIASPINNPQKWEEIIPPSNEVYMTSIHPIATHLALEQRMNGLEAIYIYSFDTQKGKYLSFSESAYSVRLGSNPEWKTKTLRIKYSSMVTPETTYDYNLDTSTLDLLKTQKVPNYEAKDYRTERLFAPSRDGVSIPISIVYRKDLTITKETPVHLYGYGAYGNSIDPQFSTNRITLLNQGFIFAIAHIRGGDDYGKSWYEQGKGKLRTNTFNDFIDAAQYLIDEEYSSAKKISISGGSAGGSLIGAVLNAAPELWRCAIAHVPFVDILNTMLNKSLPLTPIEWPEWGNPIESAEAFKTILSYSPYEQVHATDYPPIMATAGLNDPRVTYWEAAKWVAKLREFNQSSHPIILHINMGAGHGGKSGRYNALTETAKEYTFILISGLSNKESTETLSLKTCDSK